MLGVFPEAAYSSVEIRISPGDRCLLWTDGVFEARNAAQEEFGRSRCHEFLKSRRDIRPGVSPTPSWTASPVFPVTAPRAHRRTTLPFSSSISKATACGATRPVRPGQRIPQHSTESSGGRRRRHRVQTTNRNTEGGLLANGRPVSRRQPLSLPFSRNTLSSEIEREP
jgi:hypothetical protein